MQAKETKIPKTTFLYRSFDGADFKITVEEICRPAYPWIATFWDKNSCLEVDRQVFMFETFGGAMTQAFDLLKEALIGSDDTEKNVY